MKLYTLEYDCNMPVTQQVNVATNTDAKIGIKVQKNGEYLNLDGSTLSVKVGNEIVYDPITIDGTRAELTASTTTTNTTLSTDVAGSDYFGYNVAAKTIKVQISYDGTTWEDAKPTATDIVGYWYDLTVDNRRPKALINMANPQIFNVVFGPDAGTHPTELAWTDKTRIQMNANQYAYWDIKSYPCYLRICAGFQKPNYQEMLSADAELTNGYVTFPITTPDTASYVQDTVVVDKKLNDIVKVTGVFDDPTVAENPSIPKLRAAEAGLVGYSVTGEQFDAASYWYWRNANPTPTDLSGWTNPGSWDSFAVMNDEEPFSGGCVVGIDTVNGEWYNVFLHKTNGVYEFRWRINAFTPVVKTAPVWKLSKDSVIQHTGVNYKANWYYGGAFQIDFGTVANGKFKLNVNTFKSQQGDKDFVGELPYIPSKTANLSGTYADNTTFSFDVFYK